MVLRAWLCASFWRWRSGVISTTFQASFSRFIVRTAQAVGSISQHRRPWTAERGNAWWLWCQDSPNESSESQKTLVEWSSTAKRRVPKKWQTELIDHVTWCSRKMRTAPPHSAPVRPSSSVPPMSQPSAEREHEAGKHEQREAAVDGAHAGVLVEVLARSARAAPAGTVEEPAHVRVPEARRARP